MKKETKTNSLMSRYKKIRDNLEYDEHSEFFMITEWFGDVLWDNAIRGDISKDIYDSHEIACGHNPYEHLKSALFHMKKNDSAIDGEYVKKRREKRFQEIMKKIMR